MTADFFAYGSLMFADIMTAVTGRRYECKSALLHNYRRLAVRYEVYPGIRPHKGATVTGTVYFNVDKEAWKRLDLFEGKMYRREPIEVEYTDGRTAKAMAYVVRPEFTSRLSRNEWSAEEFLRSGKKRFQAQYQGFEKLDPNNAEGKNGSHEKTS